MAMPVTVRHSDLEAAWQLLQRIHTPKELSLPMVVFGTDVPPIPTCFGNPQDPFTQNLLNMINQTMVAVTAFTIATEWQLTSEEVDNLMEESPRISALRQRLLSEITEIPVIQELRNMRIQMIVNNWKK
jgi:hypothetical protein